MDDKKVKEPMARLEKVKPHRLMRIDSPCLIKLPEGSKPVTLVVISTEKAKFFPASLIEES